MIIQRMYIVTVVSEEMERGTVVDVGYLWVDCRRLMRFRCVLRGR